jgi:predicted esterase YcpF (UPF0227 family)
MLIYIHGFASSAHGSKAQQMRDWCKKEGIHFIAPTLPYIPELAIDTLHDLVVSYQELGEPVAVIGSSLGGFYATWLGHHFNLPYVLINPAAEAWVSLEKAEGLVENYHDGARFEWTHQHTRSLETYRIDNTETSKCLLLLQTGDEVLDYKKALKAYTHAETILEEGGDHGFQGFENHLKTITDFCLKYQ